jgi:hypothetical protein
MPRARFRLRGKINEAAVAVAALAQLIAAHVVDLLPGQLALEGINAGRINLHPFLERNNQTCLR